MQSMFVILNEKKEIAAAGHRTKPEAEAWITWAKTVSDHEYTIEEGTEADFAPKPPPK